MVKTIYRKKTKREGCLRKSPEKKLEFTKQGIKGMDEWMMWMDYPESKYLERQL